MTEQLAQTSTYLLEHKDDAVNWHPWGSEAIELAKRKNRPILLSIGYSSSHQCKVMTRESFSSNQIAKLMNNQYVNILVDREERPDIDRLYQTAHKLLARSGGGWPLTVFIDPNDLLPFYSGTYFPPQANESAPPFREVLNRMATTFDSQFEKIEEFKQKLKDAVAQTIDGGEPGDLDIELVARACGQIDSSFDEKYGGFDKAPKFSHPAGLELLRDAISHTENEQQQARAKYMLDFTLANISLGGLHDHIGGGLFGYSVENDWSIPHFDKTLGDNAQLISVFAARAADTGSKWFNHVANSTVDWMLGEMRLDNHGFAISMSAESNDLDGRYYTWSKDEVKGILGEESAEFAGYFGLDKSANFKGKWHLRRPQPEKLAEDLDVLSNDEFISRSTSLAQKLKPARETRGLPARDEGVVAAWNGLAIKALLDAAKYLNREDCKEAAFQTIDFLRRVHWQDKGLVAHSRYGKPGRAGFLDDYAFLLNALMTVDKEDEREEDLDFAIAIADAMIEKFHDADHGGFFFVEHGQDAPIQRMKIFSDDWFPSGNAIACMALFELTKRTGNTHYADVATKGLKAGMGNTHTWPSAHSTMVRAVIKHSNEHS